MFKRGTVMSNKIICLLLFLGLLSSIAYAIVDPAELKDPFQRDMYEGQINYYNSIKSCQKNTIKLPSIEMFGVTLDMTYYVYGRKDGECSIREHLGNSDIRCALPPDVAKKYAEEGIRTLSESVEKGTSNRPYINQIINDKNYCEIME